jgi:hypothetical protein
MTLLQKLTSTINHDLMVIYFRVPADYDFNLDDQHTKRSGSQKGYKEWLLQEYQGGTRVHSVITEEAYQMINKDISDIFAYINSTTGVYNPIEHVLVDSVEKSKIDTSRNRKRDRYNRRYSALFQRIKKLFNNREVKAVLYYLKSRTISSYLVSNISDLTRLLINNKN